MAPTTQISIIMSVYNGARHLDECIASIASQTFSDFEFIIVNDASTDNTPEILKNWQATDSRIRILHNTINRERSISRNRAITAARSPLIAIMDADDCALPHRLECQHAFFRDNPQAQLIGGDMLVYGSNERFSHYCDNDDIRAALIFDCALYHPTVMFRKSILSRIKGWYSPELAPAEDYGLWASFLPVPDAIFANIPEPLTAYRLSESPRPEYEQKQFDKANIVRGHIMRQLGLEISKENLMCHLALLFQNAEITGVTPEKCAQYAKKLLDANARISLAPHEALDKNVSARLDQVFRNHILQSRMQSGGQ